MALQHRWRAAPGESLQEVIRHCLDGARACMRCADDCLATSAAELRALRRCIQLSLDCTDRCFNTAAQLAREPAGSASTPVLLSDCAEACDRAAAECRRHATSYAFCRLCAEVCEHTGSACRDSLQTLAF